MHSPRSPASRNTSKTSAGYRPLLSISLARGRTLSCARRRTTSRSWRSSGESSKSTAAGYPTAVTSLVANRLRESAGSVPGMEPAIEVHDLVRRFGDLEAVRGVSFDVEAGETFGFLGPNGAGKSTTISMLCTLLTPSGGSAKVAGFEVAAQRAEVRKRIGLVFQDTTLDDYLTAAENLRFHAELYGVPRHQAAERLHDVLEMVGLWDRRDTLVRTFSGGMKRRLEIARGLLHSPRVLFLDEPTVGLDPQTRAHIWSYIEELRKREAITIFLTTHYMEEA